MSFNIRYDNKNDNLDKWDFRKESISELIIKYSPHIIGLQECLPNQLLYMLDNLNDIYQYYGKSREPGSESCGILFRSDLFVLIDSSDFWLSDTPEKCSKSFGNNIKRICSFVILKYKDPNYMKR